MKACGKGAGRQAAFTLVELAVVLTIVGLLLLSLMYTLSAQVDQRDFEETRRRLEQARELVLAFAIVNGRLPCPARSNSAGAEVRNAAGECKDAGGTEDYYGGTVSAGVTGGLLPAATIGFPSIDSDGFAVDAWQNRIRYAVSRNVVNCAGSSTFPHFENAANLKSNGMSCQPNDLLVCKSSAGLNAGASPPSCGGSANQVMTQGLVTAIIFSTGKNGGTSPNGAGSDEQTNLKTNSALSPLIHPLFVSHTPVPSDSANAFDDQFVWITVGELYGRLIAAGVLP